MIVFVTGATAGFGQSITRRFVAMGHQVIATGRRQERLDALQQELGASLYPWCWMCAIAAASRLL